ncbi:hypothetical protein L227DRAFT_610937 [Lentinus tigrinus ALCF2SS1-6]|uniref:F-box domain-containing protein n=1 Tax=Lentinus tigrinus ALCF2SS1-6 TaxID=1328759 RepID=A0A5C2SAX5_9APHY|nr:hypothetical protein L227DRAFT_610937 [Lentinus tigrinus ALCF2SS1-6]
MTTLDLDILFMIMELQAHDCGNDLLSMMRTCHLLRNVGVKYLLDREVTLWDNRKVLSFACFMLSRPKERFPLLRRSLCIECQMDRFSEVAGDALVRIFQRISHLRHLALLNAGAILASNLLLADAIASLTCLESLEIVIGVGDPPGPLSNTTFSEHVIKFMHAKLESVSLRLNRYSDTPPDDSTIDEIMLLLSHSASTLKYFECDYFSPRVYPIVFPRMRELTLRLQEPYIIPYVAAFPNLSRLVVRGPTAMIDDVALSSDLYELREVNLHGLEDMEERWTRLKYVSGRLEYLYVLALDAQVKTLFIDASFLWNDWTIALLPDVLADTRPTHLEMRVSSQVFKAGSSFLGRFQRHSAAQLIQVLDLDIEVELMGSDPVWDGFFMDIITCVQAFVGLRAFYLQIDVRCQLHHLPIRPGTSQGELCSLERSLRQWDGTRFAGQTKQMFPALERIFVQVSAFKLREVELLNVDLLENVQT